MQLHLLCGKSPFLWIKAILSHEWSRVRLYTYDDIFVQTQQIIKKLQNLRNIEMDLVPVVGLEPQFSMEEYVEKLDDDLVRLEPVEEDAVLFYSGTIPQLAILVSRLGYKSLMRFQSGEFLCTGKINVAIDEYYLDIVQFTMLLGYRLSRQEETTALEESKSGERIFKTTRILNIKLSNFGKIMVEWRRPDTSGQRKRTVSEIIKLNALFGRHLIENSVDDLIIQDWLKNVNMPFQAESEEE
tara:strand:+ start:153 stop:878 length:726 start_codon:yes stop_codon:yes gene_type:complete